MVVDFDEAFAAALVREVAARKLPLFTHFPDIGEADLVQEGLMYARRAWATYDASKGQPSTFICTVAGRRMIDVWRQRARRADREAVVAHVHDWVEAGDTAGLPGGAGGDAETLEEWLAGVYRCAQDVAQRILGKPGRKWFSQAQVIAAALFMRRRELSGAETAALFAAREDLRQAIGLTRIPSERWFRRARAYFEARASRKRRRRNRPAKSGKEFVRQKSEAVAAVGAE